MAKTDRVAQLPEWAGGAIILALALGPPLVVMTTLVGSWNWLILYGAAIIATLPSIVIIAMTAPLVGRQRRFCWLALVAIWNVSALWRFGADLAIRSNAPGASSDPELAPAKAARTS